MKKSWDLSGDASAPQVEQSNEANSNTTEKGEAPARGAGYSFGLSAFFMVAQMSGAGFLSLPKAISGTGWVGMAMLIVFCASVCFAAIRLGRCWVILEERWPEYQHPARQPYMEIAYRALGIWGRRLALFCVMTTLVGSTIVFIILLASMFSGLIPSLSQCQFVLIIAGVLMPFTWLGSPKDFWQASVLAVLATIVAVVVILYKVIADNMVTSAEMAPIYDTPTFSSFSLGFGAILFAFGGASVFPTIQNDMEDRSKFEKGALIAFAVILLMYVPVGFCGYYFLGSDVNSNILMSIDPSVIVTVAICLQIINLLGTFLISFSPISQAFEDMLNVPSDFGWKRVATRMSVIVFEVLVALAVPDFGLILNLIGGSTITCLSFVFPPLCYMRLVDDKSEKHWPERSISTLERVYLWAIIAVGVLGAISATISALAAILNPESFGKSCFVSFGVSEDTLMDIANSTILE